MSYVIAAPEYVASAATDLANIGSAISDAGAAAFAPTTAVLAPAGADAVSAELASLLGAHAQTFQTISAQASQFHNRFVQLMSLGAQQYGLTESANNSVIQADAAVPQQTLGHSPSGQAAVASAAGAPAQAVTVSSGTLGPGGSARASAVSMSSSGSAVAAGSVGSVQRQPISPLRTVPEEVMTVDAPAVSALPAPLAARAVPAVAAPATPRAVAESSAAQEAL